MFNVNNLSPSENKYDKGTDGNIKFILYNIGTTLLIVIPMLAVLFIVVGGIMMATASM
jgi:cytochrome b subunit of formate dehydrogenase